MNEWRSCSSAAGRQVAVQHGAVSRGKVSWVRWSRCLRPLPLWTWPWTQHGVIWTPWGGGAVKTARFIKTSEFMKTQRMCEIIFRCRRKINPYLIPWRLLQSVCVHWAFLPTWDKIFVSVFLLLLLLLLEPDGQLRPASLCTDFWERGRKKKAPEEKSYREDRGLIRGWRREGWTEAVRGCGCYRYLAWCQVKAQPICIYSDDGCSLSPPSLSHCLCNKSSKTTIFFHFKFILTQFPFWTISFEFKTQWKFINMFNTILLNLDFKNTHLSSKAKKKIYIWLHNKEDV